MMERHRKAYRALLVVYSPEYRTTYGEPMTQLFMDRMRAEGGGARTGLLWVATLADLVKTALAERLETTMSSFRAAWWRIVALPLAAFVAFAGFGNMLEPEDTAGPNWQVGAIAYFVAAVVGLALVVVGLVIRKRKRSLGSSLIAVGVMPGFPLTIMFWYPPVALVGVLSIVVCAMAFLDAPKAPQSSVEPAR